jgi:hypothetical protein
MRGAAWMVEMECSSEGPCGGILADGMVRILHRNCAYEERRYSL